MTRLSRRKILLTCAAAPMAIVASPTTAASECDQTINLPTRLTKAELLKSGRKPDATFNGTNILVETAHVLCGALITYVGVYMQGAEQNDFHLRLYASLSAAPKMDVRVDKRSGVLELHSEGKTLLTFNLTTA